MSEKTTVNVLYGLLTILALCDSFQIPSLRLEISDLKLVRHSVRTRCDVRDIGNRKLSRTDFLRVILAIPSVIYTTKYASAAVPSISEYDIGSGTVIKKDDVFRVPVFTQPVDKASTLKSLEETLNMLSSFQVQSSLNVDKLKNWSLPLTFILVL